MTPPMDAEARARLELRFLAHTLKDASCWKWQGTISPKGYGHFWTGKRTVKAHRFSYELYVRPIPEGYVLDHLCRNRRCVNPSHLEPVTSRENTMRGIGFAAENAKKTHCNNGHPFVGKNLIVPKSRPNRRVCRACANLGFKKHKRSRALANKDRVVSKPPKKTECKRGHLLTDENTILGKNGRQCRSCANASWRRRTARRRALKDKP